MNDRAWKILVVDPVGLRFDRNGTPDASEVKTHIAAKGGWFHIGTAKSRPTYQPGLHFFYQPDLSGEAEILAQTTNGQYDAAIAAATNIPPQAQFAHGGVRIGAGTGNMKSTSWGGPNGAGGFAPLMNTPSFNSRATAHMVMKALLAVKPDLPVGILHRRVLAGTFDTGKNLKDFPTEKLEGKTIAILGYGNIGREVAKLGAAFGMSVRIYARARHQRWIESEGFRFCATPESAAAGSDVLSVHTGLGPLDAKSGVYANAGLVGANILSKLNPSAVLINYDRGECVDTKALDKALKSGRIAHAAIDADISRERGKLGGPLLPYLPLAKKYGARLSLLPHAAADTDHSSRVAGAKQAVDQIFDCILHKRVSNLKGDLPSGYVNAGAVTCKGVGAVSSATFEAASTSLPTLHNIATQIASLTAPGQILSEAQVEALLVATNTFTSTLRKLGLEGPI